MRELIIIIATALISAFLALWGASVIDARSSTRGAAKTSSAPAPSSMDVMQMTVKAKNLPQQDYSMH